MHNSKKLTPEEIKRLAGEFGNTYRMKIAEGRAAYHGFLEGYGRATEHAAQEVAEKDALLKEAKKILMRAYYTGDPPKSLMNEIYCFTKKI